MTISPRPTPKTVLFWTENYVVGGCDRYLADLASGLDPAEWNLIFAGNRNDAFDAYLSERLPGALPRMTPRLVTQPMIVPARGPSDTDNRDGPNRTSREPRTPLRYLSGGMRIALNRINHRALHRLISAVAPDVLHVNNGGYPGGETCRAITSIGRVLGVPLITQVVHNTAQPIGRPVGRERELDRRVDAAIDRWITASHASSRDLSERRGIPRDRIETIHYGLPEPRALPQGSRATTRAALDVAADDLVVTVVASFEPRKGHSTLIRALAEMRSPPTVLLVGDGAERERTAREVREAALERTVRFLGWRDDVDEILGASDLLVLPSLRDECLPYAILEAMQHGLPVVGTRVAGIPEEIADGITGVVVDPGDATGLARALDRLADPAVRIAMGQAGRRRVREHFNLSRMVEETVSLWRSPSALR